MLVHLAALAIAASVFSSTSGGCGPTLVLALSASDIPADTPVSALLSAAQTHLSRGETADALVYYDAAAARDPSDYLTLFKRATAYLSLGRAAQAADDFNAVLALKPGFEGAHAQLGKLKARAAEWDAAREHYALAGGGGGGGGGGQAEIAVLEEARGAAVLAEQAARDSDWEACVSHAGAAITVATRAPALRSLRARCRLARGQLEEGLADLQHLLQMRPGETWPHLALSAVTFYALGDAERGMAAARRCLHSDPESKPCKALLRDEKAVDKAAQKAAKALEKKQPVTAARQLVSGAEGGEGEGLIKLVKDQVEALRVEGTLPRAGGDALVARLVEMACQAYYESESKKAKEMCEESLQLDENSFYGLLQRARAETAAEDWEAAIRTYEKAREARPEKGQAVVDPLLQQAQLELKRSQTKDYYKVLGVARDADDRQIKSAYRKLSKLHHPDKAAKQGLTKEAAEKKMASINEAYEVLSDPELRARFDRGDDPNSHEQQQQHGNPFQHQGGGQPFVFQHGGGGQQQFQFKFGGFPFR